MAIPMSALRRALAEMAEMSASAPMRRSAPGALNNLVSAPVGLAPIGASAGLLANMPDESRGESVEEYGNRLMGGMATGAGVAGALGAGAVLLGGARGLRMGLREALAEQAASRGMGRRAVREAADGGDASAFQRAMAGPRSAIDERDVSYSPTRIRAALKSMFPENSSEIDALRDEEAIEAARRLGISIADEGRF